jgi:hypothetical protein
MLPFTISMTCDCKVTSDDVAMYILSIIIFCDDGTNFDFETAEAEAAKKAQNQKPHPSPGKGTVPSRIAMHCLSFIRQF